MFVTYALSHGPCPTNAYYFKQGHYDTGQEKELAYLPFGLDHFLCEFQNANYIIEIFLRVK